MLGAGSLVGVEINGDARFLLFRINVKYFTFYEFKFVECPLGMAFVD